MSWRDFLAPDLGHDRKPSLLRCSVCGRETRVHSSAAVNAGVCDACLPANDDPELQRLLREDAFRRGVNRIVRVG